MRSSLVVSGGIISLTGVALFVALDGEAWLALIVGGAAVLAAGFFLEEMTVRVEPPIGHHFCPFCSTPVLEDAERCHHCNGLQDTFARPGAAQALPNH